MNFSYLFKSLPITEYKNLQEDISCIYFLSYKNKIIYIGQTENLKKRLKTHCNANVENVAKSYAYKIEKNLHFKSTKELARIAFISAYVDDIKVSILPCPIEKLNICEEQSIRIIKPIFNYAGVEESYIPYQRQKKEKLVLSKDIKERLAKYRVEQEEFFYE